MHVLPPLLCLLLAAALATGSYFLWARFTRAQVARAVADFERNGSADDLRKGYHSRENWRRFWPWLALSVVPALPLLKAGISPFALGCAALGLLLLGYFAYTFTPALNVARGLPEFHASSDSASWPDAGAWKYARSTKAPTQITADWYMGHQLIGVWFFCRLGAGVLALGAVLLTVIN